MDKFINTLDVKPSSKTTYTASIRQFLDFLQSYSISQPTSQDILTYKNYLQDKQLSSLTINNHLVSIKLFFKFLDQEKLYPNITASIKTMHRSKDFYRDSLSIDQIKDLFAVMTLLI